MNDARPIKASRESTPSAVNGLVLRIIGMSRSGNHAIINWILRQQPGDWLFLNCAEPETNFYLTARAMDDGKVYRTSIPDFDWAAEVEGFFHPKSLLAYSHEDTFLKKACGPVANVWESRFVGTASETADLLILRDPYNLFASRRRSGFSSVSEAVAVRIWKQHAKAYRRSQRPVQRAWIAITYNTWRSSAAYRRTLARRLGLPFTDAGFEEVPRVAQGSSFDGEDYDGRASLMRVDDRWRHYATDPTFVGLFDEEIRSLSRDIFGRLPLEDVLFGPDR